VRRPNGEIVSEQMPLPRMSERYPIFRYPVVRGVGTLFQAMKLGYRALRYSADVTIEAIKPGAKTQKLSNAALTLNQLYSLGIFSFLYKFIPLYVVTKAKAYYPVLNERIPFNLADGLVRMLIFLGFMWGLSKMKDIYRVFQFHGAEHKVVFNFESGKPVNVENAQRFITFHPRCGTSFLFVVIIVSIVFYTFIPFDGFMAKLLSRIALLPLIAGVSYELIRFAAKRRGSVLATMTAPGLWLQRITTKPPADDQTAVAIAALEGAMALERQQGGELVIA
jgi:uncharacterized protein YqhQ